VVVNVNLVEAKGDSSAAALSRWSHGQNPPTYCSARPKVSAIRERNILHYSRGDYLADMRILRRKTAAQSEWQDRAGGNLQTTWISSVPVSIGGSLDVLSGRKHAQKRE
jgi:hypothetical protein